MNKEFYSIVDDILNNKEFQKLKSISHHDGNRFEHSLKVAEDAFYIAKRRNMDAISVARAGLLHDFFLEKYEEHNSLIKKINIICNHGNLARETALKYFNLTNKEINIIESHMFPLGLKIPKSKEAWLITCVDKFSATKEYTANFKFAHVSHLLAIMFFIKKII